MKLGLKRAITTIILVSSFAAPLAAGPFEDANSAYDRGDYATALRLLSSLADKGDAAAQFLLGNMYDKGEGAPQNLAEGIKWHRRAADQGHTEAQYRLGFAYSEGIGVPQNYAEAVKWYRKAADQGHTEAQYGLGFDTVKAEACRRTTRRR